PTASALDPGTLKGRAAVPPYPRSRRPPLHRKEEAEMSTQAMLVAEEPEVAAATMKALVYNGPGQKAWEDVPRPVVQKPTDAVVKIVRTTICGTDLHILKGDVPAVVPGRILGHEGVGVVEEVGSGVSNFRK